MVLDRGVLLETDPEVGDLVIVRGLAEEKDAVLVEATGVDLTEGGEAVGLIVVEEDLLAEIGVKVETEETEAIGEYHTPGV